jgi:hypothetical protein
VLSRRDGYADLERWWSDCRGTRREVQLRDLSPGSLQLIVDDLRRVRPHSAVALFDVDVSVGQRVVSIDSKPRAAWTADAVSSFLELLADLSLHAGDAATIVFVDEHDEPLADRDQERFGRALRSRRAADVST